MRAAPQTARRRRVALLALLSAALLLGSAHAGSSAGLPTVASKPTIIAVGDGLTEGAFARAHDGWGLQLQERYIRKADVVNRGYGGYFSSWFVDYMLDQLFNVANPAMAILFLGTKDTLTQAVSGKHYISPQQFGANVDKIIGAAKAAGVRRFLIITPPPVCEACKRNSPKPWDRENAHSLLYVQQLEGLAKQHDAALLNIFQGWAADPAWHETLLQPDKLHLSSAGNKQLTQQILAALDAQLPDMAPGAMPLHYPLMDAIDKDDPSAAFSKVQPARASSKALVGGTAGGLHDAGAPAGEQQAAQPQPRPGEARVAAASSAALAAQGAGWLLLGVAVTAWQLFAAA